MKRYLRGRAVTSLLQIMKASVYMGDLPWRNLYTQFYIVCMCCTVFQIYASNVALQDAVWPPLLMRKIYIIGLIADVARQLLTLTAARARQGLRPSNV